MLADFTRIVPLNSLHCHTDNAHSLCFLPHSWTWPIYCLPHSWTCPVNWSPCQLFKAEWPTTLLVKLNFLRVVQHLCLKCPLHFLQLSHTFYLFWSLCIGFHWQNVKQLFLVSHFDHCDRVQQDPAFIFNVCRQVYNHYTCEYLKTHTIVIVDVLFQQKHVAILLVAGWCKLL